MTENGRDVIIAAINHYDPSIDAERLADNIEAGLDELGFEIVLPVLTFMAEPKPPVPPTTIIPLQEGDTS